MLPQAVVNEAQFWNEFKATLYYPVNVGGRLCLVGAINGQTKPTPETKARRPCVEEDSERGRRGSTYCLLST